MSTLENQILQVITHSQARPVPPHPALPYNQTLLSSLLIELLLLLLLPAQVVPGETALAFFTAKNPTKKHITGVATYNVFPLKAGKFPSPLAGRDLLA